MLARPLFGLASLTLFLAAYFVVDGISEIAARFQIKGQQGSLWLIIAARPRLCWGS